MAEQQQLMEMLTRMDAALTQQGAMLATLAAQAALVDTALTTLGAQATATDARFATGESSVQQMVAAIEARLDKTARELSEAMVHLASNLDGRLAATQQAVAADVLSVEQRMATVQQLAAAVQTPAPAAAELNAPVQSSAGAAPPDPRPAPRRSTPGVPTQGPRGRGSRRPSRRACLRPEEAEPPSTSSSTATTA
jgi:hypothetical protein